MFLWVMAFDKDGEGDKDFLQQERTSEWWIVNVVELELMVSTHLFYLYS